MPMVGKDPINKETLENKPQKKVQELEIGNKILIYIEFYYRGGPQREKIDRNKLKIIAINYKEQK